MVRMLLFVSDDKAQAAMELMVFVALMLVLSLTAYPYVLKNNELNTVLSCARDGATYGLHVLKLGYNLSDKQNLIRYSEDLKLDRIEMYPTGTVDGKKEYKVRAVITGCENLNLSEKQSLYSILRNFMRSYVNYCINGEYEGGLSDVETKYHVISFSAVCR